MALAYELPETDVTAEGNYVATSYTAHELLSPAFRFPQHFMRDTGKRDMDEIADEGYDEVIFGVTDFNLNNPARQEMLEELTQYAKSNGLTVTADLWNIGGNKDGRSLTGGEGISLYGQRGGDLCLCPESQLPDHIERMLRLVRSVGIERMFWDEAAIDCLHFEGNALQRAAFNKEQSYLFLERFTARAQELTIGWNEVCVRWRETDTPDKLEAATSWVNLVAALPTLDQISAAPYPLHPGNTSHKTPADVVPYVRPAYEAIAAAARSNNKTARAWIQGFNYSPENLVILLLCIEEVHKSVGRLAIWNHNGSRDDPSLNSAVSMSAEDLHKHIRTNLQNFRKRPRLALAGN